ncbi:hypothetical protein ACIBG5_19320 [Kribbella sp. NPDC050241]|uniref:hypothetical protein n=1 Tax=Kribbella sp. NPDC050241 TaxID=3364115 RepID=UPI003795B452
MKTPDIDAAVRGLARADREITDAAWSELSANITSEPHQRVVNLAGRRRSVRPRLIVAVACALVVAGTVTARLVDQPAQDQPQALSFTERGDKLIVRVVDPNADPKRYNAEFKKMGLDITVESVPVSPPFVGTMVSFSSGSQREMDQLHRLLPGEKCNGTLNASDPGCQDGLEIPKNYDGSTEIQFGRKAKPGEMYRHSSSSATDKGEVLAGLVIDNKTVAQVLPLIEARGVQVEDYLVGSGPNYDSKDSVPDDWYVYGSGTRHPGKVSLWVDPNPAK